MSDFAFGLKSHAELIQKLKRDIIRLENAQKSSSAEHKHQADHAFNCAVTAWHISDWVFVSGLKTRTVNATSLGNFQEQLLKECRELRVCKNLANGSKHFKIEKPEKASISTTSNKKTIGGGVIRSPVRPVVSPVVRSVTGEHTVFVVEVTFKDGRKKKAVEIFAAVLAFWNDFLREAID